MHANLFFFFFFFFITTTTGGGIVVTLLFSSLDVCQRALIRASLAHSDIFFTLRAAENLSMDLYGRKTAVERRRL